MTLKPGGVPGIACEILAAHRMMLFADHLTET
jgi:hypothetical protein